MKDKRTNAGYRAGTASGGGSRGGGGRGGGRTTRSTKISYPKNAKAKSVTRQLVKAANRAAKKDPRYTLDRMYEQSISSPTRRMTAEARREARLREKGIHKAEIEAYKEYSLPGRYAGKRNPNTAKAKKVTKPKRQPAVYAISMKPKLPSQKVPARKLQSFIYDY